MKVKVMKVLEMMPKQHFNLVHGIFHYIAMTDDI
jgi:hypothetical protein